MDRAILIGAPQGYERTYKHEYYLKTNYVFVNMYVRGIMLAYWLCIIFIEHFACMCVCVCECVHACVLLLIGGEEHDNRIAWQLITSMYEGI